MERDYFPMVFVCARSTSWPIAVLAQERIPRFFNAMKFAKKLQEELEQGWNGQSLGIFGTVPALLSIARGYHPLARWMVLVKGKIPI